MGLSVIIITKNEATDLPRALASVAFADELILLDSGSVDGTQDIARSHGALVFETSDWPGFGPQKNRALTKATHEWVLSLDADEWVEPELAKNIIGVVQATGKSAGKSSTVPDGYWIKRKSIFIDQVIHFGDWRGDRVLRLFRRESATFSNDLVHEKVLVRGVVAELNGYLGHHSVRSIEDSLGKMVAYNRVAAEKIAENNRGGMVNAVAHSVTCFLRGLIFRVGFLDGWRGIQLAWMNARGTGIKYRSAGNLQTIRNWKMGNQTCTQRLVDLWSLMAVDHGILRLLYSNLWRLPGGLFRANQPSPWDLRRYKRDLGIRSVINLRGKNEQLGWYRLEKSTCDALGIKLIDFQVYSRGLIERDDFPRVKALIESVELPALVHCKSGADRAGFFSVLYRYFRLGESIESAQRELGLKFGHFKEAKTGVLDFFFDTYLIRRCRREALLSWINRSFSKDGLDSSFKPDGVCGFFVDRVLRRE